MGAQFCIPIRIPLYIENIPYKKRVELAREYGCECPLLLRNRAGAILRVVRCGRQVIPGKTCCEFHNEDK